MIFGPSRSKGVMTHPFLLQWLAAQPRRSRIVVTVDCRSGDLLSIESVAKSQIPSALHLAHFDDQAITWQAHGPHFLRRAEFSPSAFLQQKQDVLLALEDLVSARIAALAELTDIDCHLSHELARLGLEYATE